MTEAEMINNNQDVQSFIMLLNPHTNKGAATKWQPPLSDYLLDYLLCLSLYSLIGTIICFASNFLVCLNSKVIVCLLW